MTQYKYIALAIAAAFSGTTTVPVAASVMTPPSLFSNQEIDTLIATQRARQGIQAEQGFMVKATHPGDQGDKVLRLHHSYKGLRIWESETVIVTDTQNKPKREEHADFRHGLVGNTLRGQINLVPKISKDEAIRLSAKTLAPSATHASPPDAELLLFPITKTQRRASASAKSERALMATDMETVTTGHTLAWLIKTRMQSQGKLLAHDSIISASDGSVLLRMDANPSVIGTGFSQYSGQVPIQTNPIYTGTPPYVFQFYQLVDPTRTNGGINIFNSDHANAGGNKFINTTSTWGNGQRYVSGSTSDATGQTTGVDALWGAMKTYDLLKNTRGWLGMDGRNSSINMYVHWGTQNPKAEYRPDCRCMYFGDGDSSAPSPFTTPDIVGHEMGHGLTHGSANLTYSGESAGLNESASDILGEMVEAYAAAGGTGSVIPGGNDWRIGSQLYQYNWALQDMRDPASLNPARVNYWYPGIGSLIAHDAGSPNDRMFYFLSQGAASGSSPLLVGCPSNMSGIGNDRAYRIWFNALTTRFTSSTNYADARSKMIAAAQALYGVGSREDIAVQRAYAAINVGPDAAEAGAAGCTYGKVIDIARSHTSYGTSGDIASITIKNIGGAAISALSYSCSGGSFHNYGNAPSSVAPNATATLQCRAAASGSSNVTITITSNAQNSSYSATF